MKFRLFAAAFAAIACLATAGSVQAFGCLSCRHKKCGAEFCVRQYNAFSPVASGTVYCDGFSPIGPGLCGFNPSDPVNYLAGGNDGGYFVMMPAPQAPMQMPMMLPYPGQPQMLPYPGQPQMLPYPGQPQMLPYPVQPQMLPYPGQPQLFPPAGLQPQPMNQPRPGTPPAPQPAPMTGNPIAPMSYQTAYPMPMMPYAWPMQ